MLLKWKCPLDLSLKVSCNVINLLFYIKLLLTYTVQAYLNLIDIKHILK